MDKQAIIQEVYKKHGISLSEKDPIFALVTLNDLTLSNYMEKFEETLQDHSQQYSSQLTKQTQEYQELTVKQSNTILEALNEDFAKAEKQFRDSLIEAANHQLTAIREAGKKETQNVASSMKFLQGGILVAVAVIFFLLGTAFKVYFP